MKIRTSTRKIKIKRRPFILIESEDDGIYAHYYGADGARHGGAYMPPQRPDIRPLTELMDKLRAEYERERELKNEASHM